MILAAHQLHYLPWLRYFHKIASCDTFVILDNIQFNKNGWQNRNKIKTPRGASLLTVPVAHQWAQPLSEVHIDTKQPWRRKHGGSLVQHYAKSPYFKEHEAFFREIYKRKWSRLNDLNYEILFYLVKALGLKTKIIRSSELSLRGEASERLVGICKDLGARAYLTGAYAVEVYLDKALFDREGIELIYQEFECPSYPQRYPEAGFIPDLSIVDLLFNCGPRSLEMLQGTIIASEAKQSQSLGSPRPPSVGSR
jgi:hypothetical protein